MPTAAGLKGKSFFVDTRALRRARKALGVATEAEAVRRAVERVAEMDEAPGFPPVPRGRLPAEADRAVSAMRASSWKVLYESARRRVRAPRRSSDRTTAECRITNAFRTSASSFSYRRRSQCSM